MMRLVMSMKAEWRWRATYMCLGFFSACLYQSAITEIKSNRNGHIFNEYTDRVLPTKSYTTNDLKSIELGINKIQQVSDQLATGLFERHRILCMVLSRPDKSGVDAQKAIMETWGQRCNLILFFVGGSTLRTSQIEYNANLVELPLQDDFNKTWAKVRMGMRYISNEYSAKFDWFMRIDDDSYVIMENLRLFLSRRNPSKLEMFGVDYKVFGGYVGTGAGLTMSASTFTTLVQSFDHEACARYDTHNDDVELALCSKLVNISIADSRDSLQRQRFYPMPPQQAVHYKSNPSWIWTWLRYRYNEGLECCSDEFIAFHYISPDDMRVMELMIYAFHPFSSRRRWLRQYRDEVDIRLYDDELQEKLQSKSIAKNRNHLVIDT